MVQVLYGLHCANDTCAAVLLNDFRMDGKESLMVVADFDYTFTLRLGENGEPGCLTHEVFDLNKESGYVTSFTCPPVHTLNKTMAHLRDLIHGVDRMHSSRTNILVTGDSEVDAHMVDGWQQKRVLRVGLVEDERPMLNSFDIVIKGNSFNRLRDLVKYVASTQQL
ncbi:unnamed protein product [Nippostrongylus brasiliensis]|uniref:5'-nucleotidase n=1 Tax=Nippostrongylus brasiliensis TaxID=27835 RepID=A0A0N4Y0Y4_NIPBR|nr:unnamed protein product [Nippostrongylus brasiliensis]